MGDCGGSVNGEAGQKQSFCFRSGVKLLTTTSMSEENPPKLRLKPKLATPPPAPVQAVPSPEPGLEQIQWVPPTPVPLPPVEGAAIPPAPVLPGSTEALVPPATSEAPKFVRLKPRLSVPPPAQSAEPAAPVEPAPAPARATPLSLRPLPPAAAAEPHVLPANSESEAAELAVYKLAMPEPVTEPASPPPLPAAVSFSPAMAPAPAAAPVQPEGDVAAPRVEPLAMPARPSPLQQPGDAIPTGESAEGEPPLLASPGALFPPPSAKFPRLPEAEPYQPKKKKSGAKSIIVFLLTLGLVGGGGYLAYDYLLAVPPPPEPVPRPVRPKTIQGSAVAQATVIGDQTAKAAAVIDEIIDSATQPKTAPSASASASASKGPTVTVSAPSSASSGAVVAPPAAAGVPTASLAFRAWVENLRVGGVRAAAQKVFIGGTSYSVGDLVNPQLGITFEGYNAAKRTLIFKDKTGAILEKRD